jgi:aldehyde dehydrogenase (NAD+)
MQAYLKTVYGENIRKNPDFARIIDERNTLRLKGLLDGAEILHGGSVNTDEKYVEPTIVRIREPEHPLMQEEIFGPILPLLEYDALDDAISFINNKPKPLSLYVFTRSRKTRNQVLRHTMSGAGCINDTVVHFINPHLPFGGIGMSGMGRYHGKYSFQTFTYKRSFLSKATWADVQVRYPPYKGKMNLVKFFVR